MNQIAQQITSAMFELPYGLLRSCLMEQSYHFTGTCSNVSSVKGKKKSVWFFFLFGVFFFLYMEGAAF